MSFKSYLFILVALIFLGVFSSAEPFNNVAATNSFSGATGYQYANPSYTSVYSSSDINTYWPQLAEDIANGKCYGNTDFLVMIPPAGCTPSVVRSDLLAEQNVPVFCQLESAKVNPLIKVSSIKSISFKGKYPAEIAGVSYYPSRAAINSYTTLLGSPVVNNIGYVVIILKKQGNESASPKNVSGSLTATMYYDAEKAFGVGSSEFYLKQMTDDEWEANKYLQGFWQGRGLLKLVDVQNDQATIQVQTPDGNIIRTETLTRGQTGSLFYFPGFYCRAGLQLKLNDIGSPEDSVILSVDGIQMEARKNTKLGNTGCRVTTLNVLVGDTGTVKVVCGSKTLDLGLLSLYKANITGTNTEASTYEMASKISSSDGNYYFAYAGLTKRPIDSISDNTEFIVLVKSDYLLDNKVYSEIADKIHNTFSNKLDVKMTIEEFKRSISTTKAPADKIKILFSGNRGDSSSGLIFNGLVTSEGEKVETSVAEDDKTLAAGYFTEGDSVLQSLLNDYGSMSNETGANYGESGLYEEIELTKRLQQKGMDYSVKKIELMNRFLELYPDSGLAASIRNELTIAQRTDSTNAYKSVFSNNEYHTIGIVQFKPAESSSKSFELVVNNKQARSNLGSIVWHEGDNISLSEIAGAKTSNDYLIVKSISAKEVAFEYYSTKTQNGNILNYLADGAFKLSFSQDSNVVIEPKKLNSGSVKNDAYSIYLSDVTVDKNAYVSIISDLKTTSEANFTFNIGIEQRAIKISPEQAKDQADELNKTIKSWEDKNAQLGKLVESWKAVCLTTGLALNIKNLVTGFTGQSTARQEVMQAYKSKCKAAVDKGDFPTVDACYNSYSDDIAKDVDAYTSAIEGINADIQTKYSNNLSEFQAKSTCSYIAGNGQTVTATKINSWSEARQCLLYNRLVNADITLGLQNEIKRDTAAQLDDIASNAQTNKEYETSKSQLPDLLKSSYFTAQVETGKVVKVTSFSSINKSNLRSVIVNGAEKVNRLASGDEVLGVATTKDSKGNWYLLIRGGSNAVDATYKFSLDAQKLSILDTVEGIPYTEGVAHWDVDVISNKKCVNNYTNPTVRFYESTSNKGMPAYVPVDLKEGWYAYVPSTQGNTVTTGAANIIGGITGQAISGYTDAGEVTFLYLCNVGPNGREDQRMGDDICQSFNTNNNNFEAFSGCSLTSSEIRNLVSRAKNAIRSVAGSYKNGVRRISIANVGDSIEVEPGMMSSNSDNFVCQDFFSPEECKFMYNVCDPVICPPSRCNFGGKIAVPNVIQSGILGSAVLCLKNFVGFGGDVYMPVCLTGIHAGIEGYVSILKAQQKCLSEYAASGKHVGICDEMTAVYKCEFFWRQVSPLMQNIIPSLAELAYTSKWNGQSNGGEYATFQQSWNNMQSSIDYFKSNYASTSFTAYKFGNVEEIGSTYCRNFLGTSLPTSAAAIDALLKPESPAQFYGTFSSIPYTTATVPATSQYKVFYHIYAGTDIGASYSVYLRNPPSLSYYTIPAQVYVASGYLTKGEQASESKDFTAPSGYKEMCLVVNNQEECGFNSVSTDFAVDVINDLYVQEQGGANNITTEDECIVGTSSIYSLANLNVQEGVDNAINPDISLLGITRICATENPGKGKVSSNWKNVGYCGSKNLTCWLDQKSVQNAQAVLKNVGSISEAIEYLALNSSEAKVSDDMDKTSADLSSLKKSIDALQISKAVLNTVDKPNIDAAISKVVSQASNVYQNARLDSHKANALYLYTQIYYKVVKAILNIQDSANEKTPSSSGVIVPKASALTDSSVQGVVYNSVTGKITIDGLDSGYNLNVKNNGLYKSGKLVEFITLNTDFQFEGYHCVFSGSALNCQFGD